MDDRRELWRAGTSETGVVRDADAALDAAACSEIYAPFVAETAVSFEEEPPSAASMTERIRTIAAMHHWLVLEREGEVAGYAYAGPHRERAAYRWAVDTSVYVAPAHRGTGVGRSLYGELLERLRRRGLRIACAGITLPNDASVGLHEAFGFELVGVYRRIGYKHGAWHDVGWWELELSPPDVEPAEPRPPSG